MSPGEKMVYAAAFVAYLHEYEQEAGAIGDPDVIKRARVAAAQTVNDFRSGNGADEEEGVKSLPAGFCTEMYKAMRYGS